MEWDVWIVVNVCKEIYEVFQNEVFDAYLTTDTKVDEFRRGFNRLRFLQCYGAIDGCHIEVKPLENEACNYLNFKVWYSTVLFASAY